MDPPVIRPFLTVHVFGSRGCGKTAFKTQWFESSQARAVSEIADMHIRIQVLMKVSWWLPDIREWVKGNSMRGEERGGGGQRGAVKTCK